MNVEALTDEVFDELVAIRRKIHSHPELGFEEFETQKLIIETLDSWGIPCERSVGTGVVALVEGKPGPCVGIRADMDALPIDEATDLPFKSKIKGKMHACGHDVHTTILLGAAYVLNKIKNNLNGSVKFFFQPAEETSGGALPMIEEGCLEDPKVDGVLGLHVMPYYDAGYVELKYGQLNASSDYVKIVIKGKSGHGAYPDLGVDAIYIASQVVTGVQSLVSRSTSPLDSVVFSIGKFHGGERPNIICDNVVLEGTLRTLNLETRKRMKDQLKSLVQGICLGHGAEVEIEIQEGYEPLINNTRVVDVLFETAKDLLGEDKIKFKEHPSLGVEDFSFFSNRVPGAFFHLGCGDSMNGKSASIHNEYFDVDESCMKTGVMMEVEATLRLLKIF